MKLDIKKFNEFFSIKTDIQEIALKLFEFFINKEGYISDSNHIRMYFYDLGFYSLESNDIQNDDDSYYEDYYIINFNAIKNLNDPLKKLALDFIIKFVSEEINNDFHSEFMIDDLEILVRYEDYDKINRKNKLENLNIVNNEHEL
jgi:hypothetical protein